MTDIRDRRKGEQTETERGRHIIIDGEQADRRGGGGGGGGGGGNENNMSGEIYHFVSGTLSSHTPVTQGVMPTGARRRLNNFLSCPRQSHASSCIPIGCFFLLFSFFFDDDDVGLNVFGCGLTFFFSFSSFLLNLFCGTHRSRVAIDLRLEQSLPGAGLGKGDMEDKLLPMQQVPLSTSLRSPLYVTDVPPSLRH